MWYVVVLWSGQVIGSGVSGRSKCIRVVDSKCTTFEGLIAHGAARAALGRERPQSELQQSIQVLHARG